MLDLRGAAASYRIWPERVGDGASARSNRCGPKHGGNAAGLFKRRPIFDKLPKSLHGNASALHDIWMLRPERRQKEAFDTFVGSCGHKSEKAAEDCDNLRAFYDFNAECRLIVNKIQR